MEVLHFFWLFIQDQVLGMKWLNGVIGNGLSSVGLDVESRWGGSVQFFRAIFRRNEVSGFLGVSTASEQISLLHCLEP